MEVEKETKFEATCCNKNFYWDDFQNMKNIKKKRTTTKTNNNKKIHWIKNSKVEQYVPNWDSFGKSTSSITRNKQKNIFKNIILVDEYRNNH